MSVSHSQKPEATARTETAGWATEPGVLDAAPPEPERAALPQPDDLSGLDELQPFTTPLIAPSGSWDTGNACGKGRLVLGHRDTGETGGLPYQCRGWNCDGQDCGRHRVKLVLARFARYFHEAGVVHAHRVESEVALVLRRLLYLEEDYG